MALLSPVTKQCHLPPLPRPPWMRNVLIAAGVYNILFGIWAVGWPQLWFQWSGLADPVHPMLWQCIGMIVGVYGLGYLIASSNPLRHWPIVLVGLLGKVLGPVGFAQAALSDQLPWRFGWTILTNDLVWWPSFGGILWFMWRARRSP